MDIIEALGFGLTYTIASALFFLFLYFLNKLLKLEKKSKQYLPFFGITFFFLCGSIAFILASWNDYFRFETGSVPLELVKIYFLWMFLSFMWLIFFIEFVLKRTKFLLTIYLVFCIVLVNFMQTEENLFFYMLILESPMLLISLFLFYFTFIKPTTGFLRRRMLLSLIGYLTVVLGIGIGTQFLLDQYGVFLFPLSRIITIIGFGMVGFGLAGFSTFTDINWKEKLQEIYITLNTGVCLFAFSFDKKVLLKDADLVTGGFSGIQLLLSEMMNTREKIHIIDYKNLKILFEQRENVLFILVLKSESTVLQEKLKNFADEFQFFYHDLLINWQGNMDIFKPVQKIIDVIFK